MPSPSDKTPALAGAAEPPALDVDALARALRVIPTPLTYEEWQDRVHASYEGDAAAIAVAYLAILTETPDD